MREVEVARLRWLDETSKLCERNVASTPPPFISVGCNGLRHWWLTTAQPAALRILHHAARPAVQIRRGGGA